MLFVLPEEVARSNILTVKAEISEDYDARGLIEIMNACSQGWNSMQSPEQFIKYVPWSPAEKKAARRAFDEALGRHLSAIIAEARRRMANVVNPPDLWELEAYLTDTRKVINQNYRYRYSDLLRVYSILIRDGWLKEADLVGLRPDKIAEVKDGAEALRRIFNDTDEMARS